MSKRIVSWKPVRFLDADGQIAVDPHMPSLIAIAYRGELVDKILAMPRKSSIPYARAVAMVGERFMQELKAGNAGGERGQSHWFHRNFVEFISEQGYHIELTGDEFFTPSVLTN